MPSTEDKRRRMEDQYDYEAGVRDGRLRSIEQIQHNQSERLDKHEMRLQSQERITYGLLGAIALIEFFPILSNFLHT